MKVRHVLLARVVLLSITWLVCHTEAACLEYPAAGNIRAEAGTVEVWYELPFDVTAVRPAEVWMPGYLFYVRQEDAGVESANLLLRLQSIPAVRSADGTVTRARTDGICCSPKGDGMYFTYEQLGIKGQQVNHIAISWDGDRVWGISNGKQFFATNPGSGGNYTVPQLFQFSPYESVICLGLSAPAQLMRIYALRISNCPRSFSAMTAIPQPKEDVSTLLLDDFSTLKEGGASTTTVPCKSSPMVREGRGTIKGLWHTGSTDFGKYVALWPADAKLEALIPASPTQDDPAQLDREE